MPSFISLGQQHSGATTTWHLNGSPGCTRFLEFYFCTLFVPISPLAITCHCFGFALCSSPSWPPHLWGFCLLCAALEHYAELLALCAWLKQGMISHCLCQALWSQINFICERQYIVYSSQISSLKTIFLNSCGEVKGVKWQNRYFSLMPANPITKTHKYIYLDCMQTNK